MKIEFKNGIFEVNTNQIILVQQDANSTPVSITEIELEQISANQKAIKIKGDNKWILSQYFLQYEFIDVVNKVSSPSIIPDNFKKSHKNPPIFEPFDLTPPYIKTYP